MDSERTWEKFSTNVIRQGFLQRYIRINPELSTAPPALDDEEKLWSLEADVKRRLGSMNEQICHVADRLLASCFYFEKADGQSLEDQITGMRYHPAKIHAAENTSNYRPNLLPI